ncbi:MAG: hypothetical protein M0P71_04565 [Melioribacteraceae bacterium]|nr:hypothetical protein [Melioribacteraceae bacterium]
MKLFFKSLFQKIVIFTSSFWHKSKKGIAIGAISAMYLYAFIIALNFTLGYGKVIDILFFSLFISLAIYLTYSFSKFLFSIVKRFDAKAIAIFVATFIAASFLPMNSFLKYTIILWVVSFGTIAFSINNGLRRLSSIILIIIIVAINLFAVYFYGFYGEPALKNISTSHWNHFKRDLQIDDPSLKGNFQVATLYYGSGSDNRRPEYKDSISIKTNSIDLNKFFNQTSGFKNWVRKIFWGFNSSNYPINGRVWYPDGTGKFPLVLIVHGNHGMEDFSDPGYEYLGKHLASKGYITVSVDENFLNASWTGDYQQNENFTRGYLLLEHLKNWAKWNSDSSNQFFNKIDMNNIALIGHSRGGQAVAIAAAINKLPKYFIDGKIKFDFNFGIKSIIQIAPNDPYQPKNGKSISLKDINYLLIQGGFDYDVGAIYGNRQYNRISFSQNSNCFKSLIYIYRANHGNFNTMWGNYDFGFPSAFFMNTEPLLVGEQQRKIAKVYITSFLESSLNGKKHNLQIFKDFRNANKWIPKDYYISQYEDSKFNYLSEFDDDLDLTTSNTKGISIDGVNLSVWSENSLTLRDFGNSLQDNYGVYLGWNQNDSLYKNKTATYSFTFNDSLTKQNLFSDSTRFFFFIANNKVDIDTTDLSIVLSDNSGNQSSIRLCDYYDITPVLESNLSKNNKLAEYIPGTSGERVLQYCEIPIADFRKINPKFNSSLTNKISFIFDRQKEGEIILDKIGYYN